MEADGEKMTDYRKTICPLDCPDSCGMIATIAEGRVTGLAGDPEHPFTSGYICRKMRRYHERVHGSDRLLYPQLRIGKKGGGHFRRISWDEALDILARKIVEVRDRFGGEAILPYQYAGNMGVINRNAGYPLYHKVGASRLLETICSSAAGAAWDMHLPGVPGSPPEIAADAELIVAWGINIKVTNIHFWQYVAAARKKGARLVVIDPYRNQTAKTADQYLQVLPGGDGALALGALKTLIEESLLDRPMLAAATTGFEALERYVRQTPWPEIVRLSGVERHDIQRFGRLLQANQRTFLRIGIGLSRNSRGGMNVRSILSFAAALGLFEGGEGRGVLLSTRAFVGDVGVLRSPELMATPTREVNMAHLGHALTQLEPPVRMLIVYNCNPLSVAPDASMVRQGLAREDLFTAVHEQVMTPTARYADLLLPATTFLENRDLYTGYGHFQLGVVSPVIQPVGEARSNFELFQALASRLGFSDPPFRQTLEERLQAYLATIEGLPDTFVCHPEEESGWVTSTRKRVSLSVFRQWGRKFRFVSHGFEEKPGVPAFACLQEPGELADRDLCARLPFMLLSPPHNDLLNSTFGERFAGEMGSVLIHPQDAAEQGLADGAVVKLENLRGKTIRRVRVSDDTRRGLLVAEGIFWEIPDNQGGVNDLASQKTTDIGGGPTFHETRVALSRM